MRVRRYCAMTNNISQLGLLCDIQRVQRPRSPLLSLGHPNIPFDSCSTKPMLSTFLLVDDT